MFFAVKFRYREGKNDNPKQIHGNTRLEIGWTIVPALLLAVVAVPTISTIFSLADQSDASALEVTVVAKQWWWQFEYTDAKVVTADELIIPTGRNVHLKLKACEENTCNVIHSFWVPELAGTRDVVPGRTNELTLSADEPGTFLGQCKEYCGLSHANMRFRVIAKTPKGLRAMGQRTTTRAGAAPPRGQRRRSETRGPGPGAHRHQVPVHELPCPRRLVDRRTVRISRTSRVVRCSRAVPTS